MKGATCQSIGKGWNRGEVGRFLDSTFKRSQKIADILRHDPPFFNSNHVPFMKKND